VFELRVVLEERDHRPRNFHQQETSTWGASMDIENVVTPSRLFGLFITLLQHYPLLGRKIVQQLAHTETVDFSSHKETAHTGSHTHTQS
jgi:hypothetical protein